MSLSKGNWLLIHSIADELYSFAIMEEGRTKTQLLVEPPQKQPTSMYQMIKHIVGIVEMMHFEIEGDYLSNDTMAVAKLKRKDVKKEEKIIEE